MKSSLVRTCVIITLLAVLSVTARIAAQVPPQDFGSFVQHQLKAHAQELFGVGAPLDESAPGPFNGPGVEALELAHGLSATLVSSAVHFSTDQIALWPNDDHPTHLFVCDEETSNPAVQRIDLAAPAASNATTIVTGLLSCDPVRRTPWGTIVVGEEHGNDGGLYEILDPLAIASPIAVTDRAAGTTSDANHLVKRKAAGALSWESLGIRGDGTMIYGDELAPGNGAAGGGLYKFVPTVPYFGTGQPPVTIAALSPLASGAVYGLRVAANGSSNWGQGAEVGKGRWVAVDLSAAGVLDAAGNIHLRAAQAAQKFTGYYRPEDMDIDPIAAKRGVFRACWANTGRMSHTDSSLVENSGVKTEIMCLVENPPSAAAPTAATGSIPVVTRFVVGSQQAGMFDNVAFQPHTGNLVVLEDGPTSIVTPAGPQPRGNDLWICLPDGADDDTLSDGCVRFASVSDTSAEPSGFIFVGSGESAFVSIQHRAVNDAAGEANHGALLKISGFKVR